MNLLNLESRLENVERERDELERRLITATADLAGARVRLEELEDQHGFDERRFEVLDQERSGLRTALRAGEEQKQPFLARIDALSRQRDDATAHLTELTTERDRLADQLAHARADLQAKVEELDAQAGRGSSSTAEQRALLRTLARTQATLEARTEQLGNILRSRWHRLARSSWQARRRRPPLGALGLAAVALAGVLAAALIASTAATIVAAVLAAGIVLTVAVAYAIVVPALRDKRVPRMAGQGTFAEPLPDETAAVERLAARVGEEDEEPPAASATAAAPAPVAGPASAVAPVGIATRLVPALPSADGDSRARWLAASRTLTLRQLKVAGVLDDMSRACFDPECTLNCDFTMADWRERLEADPPHMLLVESAWSGNRGGWQYGVASYTHPDYRGLPALRELISWCRERGIPTVFWNKEDPIHFERFKEAAVLFDHVFTTDANRIPAYEELRGEPVRTVQALAFAAQPKLHNPVAAVEPRRPEPVFAGTYYRNRHQDRRASLEMILDAARPHGLIIYDRTFGTESDEYGFPERFLPHIKGRLSYDQVVDVYKRHRVFLNVNSVTDSPTMFSRRVFELLACGTAVISTESVGIEATFGELVPIVRTPEEATAKLEQLLGDDAYYAELTSRARRLVLAKHSYRKRLAEIAKVAGFEISPQGGHELAALALVDDPVRLPELEETLLRQSRAPEETVVGLGRGVVAEPALSHLMQQFGGGRVRTVAQDLDAPRSERWRELAALTAAPWVAPLNPETSYDEHHLRDLGSSTEFASAEVIGVAATPDGSHRYVESVDPSRALATRSLIAEQGWADDALEQRLWFERGVRFYASEHHPTAARGEAGTSAPVRNGAHGAPRRARGVRRR